MALTNPTKLINLQELAYFESKLALKYQTQAISAEGITADTVEGALEELKSDITSQISAVYKPAGDIAAAGLVSSLLVEGNLGKVYNLTDDATTTADWKEGAGYTIEAGTDVAIVAVESGNTTTYKFNAFGKKVDLSNYKTKQSAVQDSDATTEGTGATFVDSVTQNANGEITVHKKGVQGASASQDGLMSSADYSKLAALPSNSDLEAALAAKANKVTVGTGTGEATAGNLFAIGATGDLEDSGYAPSDFQAAGSYKTTQTAKTDPTADGNALAFIDSITQNANGEITATKKNITVAADSDIDEIFA